MRELGGWFGIGLVCVFLRVRMKMGIGRGRNRMEWYSISGARGSVLLE